MSWKLDWHKQIILNWYSESWRQIKSCFNSQIGKSSCWRLPGRMPEWFCVLVHAFVCACVSVFTLKDTVLELCLMKAGLFACSRFPLVERFTPVWEKLKQLRFAVQLQVPLWSQDCFYRHKEPLLFITPEGAGAHTGLIRCSVSA